MQTHNHIQQRINPVIRPHKKFAFTKSTTTLPKQHPPSQFSLLIQEKKNYQSMIKEQIRKLEDMETCIEDPQVQVFSVGEEIFSKKNQYNGRNQNEKKVDQKRDKEKKVKDDIDEYLDREINAKTLKMVQKLANKYKTKRFYQNLKSFLKASKQTKASNYHYYTTLTSKYFTFLKQKTNPNSTPIANQSQTKLHKYLLKNSFSHFNRIINNLRLKNRVNVYKKMREFRVKKDGFGFMRKRFGFIGGLEEMKRQNIRNVFMNGMRRYRDLLSLAQARQMIQKVRRHRALLKFVKYVKLFRQIEHLKQQLQVTLQQSQKQKQNPVNYIKSTLPIEYQAAYKVKQSHLILQNSIITMRRKILIKQLLNLMKKNAKISQFHNKFHHTTDNQSQNNSLKYVFLKLKENYKFNANINRVRSIFSRKYAQNLIKNIQSDHLYYKSITKCLSGSKEWLIKNKHIFKSQPMSSKSQQNSKLQQKFTHPFSTKSPSQLLPISSKYKKTLINHFSKLFLSSLQSHYTSNKKLHLLQQTHTMLHNQHLLRLVFSIFKDRKGMRNILGEIREEEERDDKDIMEELGGIVENTVIGFTKRKFIGVLRDSWQYRGCQDLLAKRILVKKGYQFLAKLKQQSKKKYNNAQLFTKTNNLKCTILKKRWQNLTQVLSSQKNNKQLQNFAIAYQKVKQTQNKQQFLNLMAINHRLTKNSVRVTSEYVKNRLKFLQKSYKIFQQRKNIGENAIQFNGYRRQAILVSTIGKMRKLINIIVDTRAKRIGIQNEFIKNNKKKFIKKLKQGCRHIGFGENLTNLSKLLRINRANQVVNKLRSNVDVQKLRKLHKKEEEKLKEANKNKRNLQAQAIPNLKKLKQHEKQQSQKNNKPNFKQTQQKNISQSEISQISQYSPSASQSPSNKSPQKSQNFSSPYKNHIDNLLFSHLPSLETKQESNLPSDREISYEEYRKSIIEAGNKDKNQNQGINIKEQAQGQRQHENQIEPEEQRVSEAQQMQGLWDYHLRKKNYGQQSDSIHEQFPQKQASQQQQEQDSSLPDPDTSQLSAQSSHNPDYNIVYIQNRYQTNLTAKIFKNWKQSITQNSQNPHKMSNLNLSQHNSQQQQQEQEQQPVDMRKITAIFQAWHSYSRHKKLVRAYLQQYDNENNDDYHYYPENREELEEFYTIVRN